MTKYIIRLYNEYLSNFRPSCTECAPRYFVDGRDVTETCTIISGLRTSGAANIGPSGPGAHLFIGSNGEFLNIPNGGRPPQAPNTPGLPPQRRTPLIDPLTRQPLDPMFLEQLDTRARRVMDPRMVEQQQQQQQQQQQFPGDMRRQQMPQLPPGVAPQNIDPRFLRALLENENAARMANRPNGPPFDPRIGQFMRPGSPPVSFQQMASLRGQNLDVDAVRRFMAEQGLRGTANVGGPERPTRVPPQALMNRIEELRNRGLPSGLINQALQNSLRGGQRQQLQGPVPGNQAAPVQRPTPGANAQQLQALRSEFAAFRAGQMPNGNAQGQNAANQAPQTPPNLSIQSAQRNPLGTIQAAMRQFQRQAVRSGGPRSRSNVI